MEQGLDRSLADLDQRMAALDQLLERNPLNNLLVEYEVEFLERPDVVRDRIADDPGLRDHVEDLAERAALALRLLEAFHLCAARLESGAGGLPDVTEMVALADASLRALAAGAWPDPSSCGSPHASSAGV
jgi:hypothetical protein